jgi:hypothetical protein
MRFFSQKLCICIALNDTFLSIVAHHCFKGTVFPEKTNKGLYTDPGRTNYTFTFLIISSIKTDHISVCNGSTCKKNYIR